MKIINSLQYTGENLMELHAFVGKNDLRFYGELAGRPVVELKTKTGEIKDVSAGSYIVKYEDGSFDLVDFYEETPVISEEFDFGGAIARLKDGMKVARKGWNGKGMFIFLVPGSSFKVNRPPLLGIYEEGTQINYLPHIDMRTADGHVVPWLASQSDMLSTDWVTVE